MSADTPINHHETTPAIDEAARIIDSLLKLMQNHDFNAVDDAVAWLRKNDRPDRWLSCSTRDLMEAANG